MKWLYRIFAILMFMILQMTFSHAADEFKLTASDKSFGDEFGSSVSISGNTAIVGAPLNNDAGVESGSAYIFVYNGTRWGQQAKLTASDAQAGDRFGQSVGISGDTVVVGAFWDGDAGSQSGSAYIFIRDGDNWVHQSKLTASDAQAGDHFGHAVGISGDTVIIGAIGNDDAGIESGAAYIFTRDGSAWSEQTKLIASDAAASDWFGWSVSIEGNTAVVGAIGNDDAGSRSGSAYVYVRDGENWNERAKLTASDAVKDGNFGHSAGISGETVIIGAPGNSGVRTRSGSAYIFERNGEIWAQAAKLIANDVRSGDGFGFSVGISGETVIVGAPFADDASGNSGNAYIFEREELTWTLVEQLIASDAAAGDEFGAAVGISDALPIVGARLTDETRINSGAVYIYNLESPPQMVVTPNPIPIGTGTLSIQNKGGTDISVIDITSTTPGKTLKISPTSFTVPPGATFHVTLTWKKGSDDPDNTKLIIISNAPSSPTEIPIGESNSVFPLGDVSGDGIVNTFDALLILQFVSGLIDTFPVEELIGAAPTTDPPRHYEVSVPQISARRGEPIFVPVAINDVTGFLAGGVTLKYDPTVLRATSTHLSLSGAYWKANTDHPGEVRVAFASLEAIDTSDRLFVIKFDVLPDAAGDESPLTLDYVELSNSLSVKKMDGLLTLAPERFRLHQNFPNPFNPETWIPYQLAADTNVTIAIYNAVGESVRRLDLGMRSAGVYLTREKAAYWDGRSDAGEKVASGVYFYVLEAGDYRETRKMLIVK